jgi:hypothetical protein
VLKVDDSVGKGGKNRIDDVRLVQQLVNRFRPPQLSLLKVDGLAGVLTTAAIEQFQKDSLNMAAPDGLVSPLGPTFNALTGNQPAVERVAWGAKVSGAFKVKVLSIEDTYMAILYPAAIGQPPDHPLFSKGTTVYNQNAGLDQNKDGIITVQEAAAAVRRKFDKGVKQGFLG